MQADIDQRLDALTPRIIAWRRQLHADPELSFVEHRTGAFIAAHLEALGIEVSRPSGTSVMGRLFGKRQSDAASKVLAIRADFDALPITEATGLPFASRNPGVMHACGHDGHTAILLGVATLLSEMRAHFSGEVRFLFENGEETPPGGARGMVDAGAMKGVDRVIGLHLWAPYETGTLMINDREVMAACDTFSISVTGVGGHVGAPHKAVDPIAVAAQIVINLQHLVAREVDPLYAAVIGVTEVHAGHSVGVIPAEARISGGTNSFDPAVRDLIEKRIGEVAEGVCAAHRAKCTYSYNRTYDAVINDPSVAADMRRLAERLYGPGAAAQLPPIMPGEDFSAFAQEAPACFMLVGAGNRAKGITAAHHDPAFDIDEDALSIGARLFLHAALDFLGA